MIFFIEFSYGKQNKIKYNKKSISSLICIIVQLIFLNVEFNNIIITIVIKSKLV